MFHQVSGACKHYSGPAHDWVNNSFGGLLYEVFWCVIGALVFPRTNPLKIALSVFIATCTLETLQLFDWGILRFVRSFYIGQVLIGTTFTVSDFLYYILGCLLGWVVILQLKYRSKATR